MLRDETRRLVENEVLSEGHDPDREKRDMSRDLVDKLAEMGFFTSSSPRSTRSSALI